MLDDPGGDGAQVQGAVMFEGSLAHPGLPGLGAAQEGLVEEEGVHVPDIRGMFAEVPHHVQADLPPEFAQGLPALRIAEGRVVVHGRAAEEEVAVGRFPVLLPHDPVGGVDDVRVGLGAGEVRLPARHLAQVETPADEGTARIGLLGRLVGGFQALVMLVGAEVVVDIVGELPVFDPILVVFDGAPDKVLPERDVLRHQLVGDRRLHPGRQGGIVHVQQENLLQAVSGRLADQVVVPDDAPLFRLGVRPAGRIAHADILDPLVAGPLERGQDILVVLGHHAQPAVMIDAHRPRPGQDRKDGLLPCLRKAGNYRLGPEHPGPAGIQVNPALGRLARPYRQGKFILPDHPVPDVVNGQVDRHAAQAAGPVQGAEQPGPGRFPGKVNPADHILAEAHLNRNGRLEIGGRLRRLQLDRVHRKIFAADQDIVIARPDPAGYEDPLPLSGAAGRLAEHRFAVFGQETQGESLGTPEPGREGVNRVCLDPVEAAH
ncbi:MAG: hypothetical protein BWY73_01443 [candidate division TA06 bacterium ADurb.Bin417]|uniref:Uncharacterized protein n=1 Tax=candidate division TA06 bacterium ADurb.Bin417 TaxID=1852828 RepID=A0A1V5M9C9_UNCT6|nr:MAG: hypothetical protein BWY73_01443 [candidate division TA06 bacterium ADurb.Bin417]